MIFRTSHSVGFLFVSWRVFCEDVTRFKTLKVAKQAIGFFLHRFLKQDGAKWCSMIRLQMVETGWAFFAPWPENPRWPCWFLEEYFFQHFFFGDRDPGPYHFMQKVAHLFCFDYFEVSSYPQLTSPLKPGHPKRKTRLRKPSIFRCKLAVSSRECILFPLKFMNLLEDHPI